MDLGQRIGALLISGSTIFLLLWKVAEFIRPGYSVSQEVISRLGVGENAWVFNTSVILLGLFGIAAGYLLYRVDRVVSTLLLLSSLGAIGVGVFPMDNPVPHAISALAAFLFSGLAAIASVRMERGFLGWLWVVLGLISVSSLALFLLDIDLGLGIGGIERMIVYPVMIWLYTFGAFLMINKSVGVKGSNEPLHPHRGPS